MSAAKMRARALLKRLPEGRVYGAELGVWDGRMSQILLLRDGLTLMMVDAWAPKDARPEHYLESGDKRAICSDAEMEQAHRLAIASTGFAQHRAQIVRSDTALAAERVPEHTMDFVFVDADHSFEGVCRDLIAWRRRVKPGGWIGGHDYGDPCFPGVEKAVDLFFGDAVECDENSTWFVRL